MLFQIDHAFFKSSQILNAQLFDSDTTVVFERAHCGHQHHGRWGQACLAAFDVDEFFSAQISAKTSLGDHVIGQFGRCRGGDDRIATVGDVGKRAAVDESQIVFKGLRDVGCQSVFQQSRHGAVGLQIAGQDRGTIGVVSHDDATQTVFQVTQTGGQTENGHHFGSYNDVETVFPRHAVGGAAQAHHHLTQGAVVHVHDSLPGDATRVNFQGVAMVDVVVQHGRQQVVRQGNGTEVPGEVQVDVFHRDHLRHATPCGTALHAKHRTQGRFTQANETLLANLAKCITQAHSGGGFAFSRWRG